MNGCTRKRYVTKKGEWQFKKEIAYDIVVNHPEMVTLINGYTNLLKGD